MFSSVTLNNAAPTPTRGAFSSSETAPCPLQAVLSRAPRCSDFFLDESFLSLNFTLMVYRIALLCWICSARLYVWESIRVVRISSPLLLIDASCSVERMYRSVPLSSRSSIVWRPVRVTVNTGLWTSYPCGFVHMDFHFSSVNS